MLTHVTLGRSLQFFTDQCLEASVLHPVGNSRGLLMRWHIPFLGQVIREKERLDGNHSFFYDLISEVIYTIIHHYFCPVLLVTDTSPGGRTLHKLGDTRMWRASGAVFQALLFSGEKRPLT